jgi:hypothetical protein
MGYCVKVYAQTEGTEMNKRERSTNLNGIKKVLSDEQYLQEKHGKLMNVLSKAEYVDPIRNSTKPITKADIAEVQMDLIILEHGRDINEIF